MKTATILFLGLLLVAAPAFAAESYDIDNVHSSAIFKVQHLGAGFTYGRFNVLSGKFDYDEADASKSSIEINIKADSIDTNSKARDDHVKDAFFNTKQFPLITFKSTKIEKTDKAGEFKVTGDLTLMGVTKSITITVAHTGAAEGPDKVFRRGFETRFSIKRSDYGMKTMIDKIGDDVELTIAIEGTKK